MLLDIHLTLGSQKHIKKQLSLFYKKVALEKGLHFFTSPKIRTSPRFSMDNPV